MMQTNLFRIRFTVILLIAFVFFNSCQKDEISNEISTDNAEKAAQIDVAVDEMDGLIEEAYMAQEGLSSRTIAETAISYMPPCVTKTVVMSGTNRTVTLDFGTGCVMPNGNTLSGIIKMVYEHNLIELSKTIHCTFENFKFNEISFTGGAQTVRILRNTQNNPQSTSTFDITATFPDGGIAHRNGSKVREWIAGFGTKDWQDNVFLITGNWTTEFKNGDVNKGNVTTALRREATCPFFVSGVVELSHNERKAILDFGEGTCDNVAIFIDSNGVSHIIKLKK